MVQMACPGLGWAGLSEHLLCLLEPTMLRGSASCMMGHSYSGWYWPETCPGAGMVQILCHNRACGARWGSISWRASAMLAGGKLQGPAFLPTAGSPAHASGPLCRLPSHVGAWHQTNS